MSNILPFIISLFFLVLLDLLFLGYIMKDYYFRLMSPAVTVEFNFIYAGIFYVLYMIGIFIFVLYPNIDKAIFNVAIYGALFGFFCYMTYDFTNMATIKNWPQNLIYVDILWGSFVTMLVSVVGYYFYHLLK